MTEDMLNAYLRADEAFLAAIARGEVLDECHPAAVERVRALSALRDAARRATMNRDDAADAYARLVRDVWEAATGDTHEGPASMEALINDLRQRPVHERAVAEMQRERLVARMEHMRAVAAEYVDAEQHMTWLRGAHRDPPTLAEMTAGEARLKAATRALREMAGR